MSTAPDATRPDTTRPDTAQLGLGDPNAAAPWVGDVASSVTPTKPRARGWIHLWSLLVAVIPGIALVVLAAATVSGAAAAATAIYTATVLGLFGASAAYHRGRWAGDRPREWMRRLDHSMIYVFIAGTYTPITVLALPSDTDLVVLAVAWSGAGVGVALTLLWPSAPRWAGVPLYLALGWVAVFVLPDLLRHGGVAVLALIITGGLIYSLGAVGFAARRPRGRPATFGFHEYFHTATVAAALCHHVAIWLLLYP